MTTPTGSVLWMIHTRTTKQAISRWWSKVKVYHRTHKHGGKIAEKVKNLKHTHTHTHTSFPPDCKWCGANDRQQATTEKTQATTTASVAATGQGEAKVDLIAGEYLTGRLFFLFFLHWCSENRKTSESKTWNEFTRSNIISLNAHTHLKKSYFICPLPKKSE